MSIRQQPQVPKWHIIVPHAAEGLALAPRTEPARAQDMEDWDGEELILGSRSERFGESQAAHERSMTCAGIATGPRHPCTGKLATVFWKTSVVFSAHADLGLPDQPCSGAAVHRPRPGGAAA
jgi:hypothetical protein